MVGRQIGGAILRKQVHVIDEQRLERRIVVDVAGEATVKDFADEVTPVVVPIRLGFANEILRRQLLGFGVLQDLGVCLQGGDLVRVPHRLLSGDSAFDIRRFRCVPVASNWGTTKDALEPDCCTLTIRAVCWVTLERNLPLNPIPLKFLKSLGGIVSQS